jgi:beta-galactosidase
VVDDPIRGKVLELDGDGDWVDCGDDLLFGMTEEITLSGWIKTAGPTLAWRLVMAKGTSWKLQGWKNALKFVCGVDMPGDIGVNSGVVGKKAVNDGRWHHVAGVYDGRTATLYIDGQRDVSATVVGSIAANSFNVWIGADSERGERGWSGRIDDARIYSYALTAKEIRTLYESSNEPGDKAK